MSYTVSVLTSAHSTLISYPVIVLTRIINYVITTLLLHFSLTLVFNYYNLTLMQITVENFQEKLPTIVNAIRTCEFVAVDCEFTGNLLDLNDKPHEYDTFDDKYRKNKQAVEKFLAF